MIRITATRMSTALRRLVSASAVARGYIRKVVAVSMLVAALASVTQAHAQQQQQQQQQQQPAGLRQRQTDALPGVNSFFDAEGAKTTGTTKDSKKLAKQKQKAMKLALAKGQKADGSADYLSNDKTSSLATKEFQFKDSDKSSLMKEANYFQRKFEVTDVLAGKKSILADKPVLQFDKEYETKKASGFDANYETKKSNLSKEWNGGKPANIEMKDSSLDGRRASGFDKVTPSKPYYGPVADKLANMDEPGQVGGIDNHQLFTDEPITVGQVRNILKNGNQNGKEKPVLKATPVNDKPVDSVGQADQKPGPRPKVVKFLPSESEKESMDRHKAEQDAYEAERKAAGDIPSSMQRKDDKPLLIVPITEDEDADQTHMPAAENMPASADSTNQEHEPSGAPQRFTPAPTQQKSAPAHPQVEPVAIPGDIPAGSDEEPPQSVIPKVAPDRIPSMTPAAPAPAPAAPAPRPLLPGRLGRNNQQQGPMAPAPVSQPPAGNNLPVVDITDGSSVPVGSNQQAAPLTPVQPASASAPQPAPEQQQAPSAPVDMLVPVVVQPGTRTYPATTSAVGTTPVSSATPSIQSTTPSAAIPTARPVDARRPNTGATRQSPSASAKPAASKPSASNKPANSNKPSASNKDRPAGTVAQNDSIPTAEPVRAR